MQPDAASEGNQMNTQVIVGFLKNKKKISKKIIIAVILIFAALGAFLLWRSFAAQAVLGTIEGENMQRPASSNASQVFSQVTDYNASADKAGKLSWTQSVNGSTSVQAQITLGSPVSSFTAVAHSNNKCSGRQAYITVTAVKSGEATVRTLLPKVIVKSTSWASYSANPSLSAGTYTVTVKADNLIKQSSCDSSLYVDILKFLGAAPTAPAAPTLAFSASPSSVDAGQSSELSWTSTGASSCTASGAWAGTQATYGSFPTGALSAASTYNLSCTGSGGSISKSVTVGVNTTTTPTSPPPPSSSFKMGVVAGSALSYELQFVHNIGAKSARMEFGIGTSTSTMDPIIDAYAKAGVRPLLLAGFYGRTPTTSEAQNLANWAKAYGPGGTFWQGKTYPSNVAVTQIEFGNETSYSYQFSDNSTGTYQARAQAYAQRAKEAATAIAGANPNVGLLVQGDNAQQGTTWVQYMFKAVPNLGDYAAGWTIHPYGPNWATRIDSTVNSTKNAGSPDRPIWVTEWGLSSDNGRCLDDNYGWNKCMTYSEAASTLHTALGDMQSRYGGRLGAFYLYQAHDLYGTGTKTSREAYFGAVQSNNSAKGAYTTEAKADLAAYAN